MQPATNETGVSASPRTKSGDRKRKRQSGAGLQPEPHPPIVRQQSLHLLFPTSGKAVSNSSTSPPTKRVRQQSPPHSPPSRSLPLSKMYSFPSKQASVNVIDLTGSPPKDDQKPRVGAVTPLRNGARPKLGSKKLVVKNLRKQPEFNPEHYFDITWGKVEKALNEVLSTRGPHTALSTEELYRAVESLCRQGKASTVNARFNDRCCKHLEERSRSLRSPDSQDDIVVLQSMLEAWAEWQSQVVSIRCIFYYMDRSYLLSHSKTNLWEVCTGHFRKIVFEDAQLRPRAIEGACELISRDRRGLTFERTVLRDAATMFHTLAVYTATFEPRFLARSQQYITMWVDEAVTTKSLAEYVTDVTDLIQREMERCKSLGLDPSTERDLVDSLESHAVQSQVDFLTKNEAVAQLLNDNNAQLLADLYRLLKWPKLGAKLKPAFSAWIESTGTAIIFDEKAQDDMVIRLLSLKRRLDDLWRTSFQRDVDLGHGMREAFEKFMNKTKKSDSTWGTDNSKTGEMIAKYVDLLLRGGSKVIPAELNTTGKEIAGDADEDDNAVDEDAEVNDQLDQVLDLFRFIHGKAIFEAFYKKDLAKRLLMGRSASADAERSMLIRLKTECGSGFTQNLEQMFKDIELGREEMAGYRDRLEQMQDKPGALDLNVSVLAAAAWPSYPDVPVTIPSDVHTAIEAFERHYQVKHSGRKLAWKHSLAHCQMKAAFPRGTKEFVVSSFQAIVLLLFNNVPGDEKLTYEHIKTVSGLPEAEVKRTLQSLACAKLRPLTKHPLGREINSSDAFSINTSFVHPKYRVRINQVQLKETKQENKETHERVAEDRNFECQAAVVRIMKSRKTIGHSELVAEVINATKSRGVLGVPDIKRNIDRLIEKDYMERDEGNTYSYVA